MTTIYVVRHCEAEGQPPEASLTEKGFNEAKDLANFFSNVRIDRILSSPFKRAIQSIQPLAEKLEIDVEINNGLAERTLSTINMPDWLEKIKETYEDMDLKYKGGESSKEAMDRIVNVVEKALISESQNIVIVTHGNIMSLLLRYYNRNFGFNEWSDLTNPDVYMLKLENNKVNYERLWQKNSNK
ncbi:2,3-bisphosphoglycerate-dependent phosphoglycerate mutase [Evansella vedderi]|uniref:2,3-bisphosphoglycerate-dependent phosphoglycerate mutase n=1 Tax=Evansella vedderi TaxID=38282 RepID=A0ABT9ZQM9_9BACI|nr:histidine phosphatase family protein [Evansella vedderi]MDQ0253546.1 2,3-bisphosphoglycerate-dependent phosphoglycerate mutase [Evansella vedderi]